MIEYKILGILDINRNDPSNKGIIPHKKGNDPGMKRIKPSEGNGIRERNGNRRKIFQKIYFLRPKYLFPFNMYERRTKRLTCTMDMGRRVSLLRGAYRFTRSLPPLVLKAKFQRTMRR